MKSVFIMAVMLVIFSQAAFAEVATGGIEESALSQAIVGKWAAKKESSVASISGVTEYCADGTARMNATAVARGRKLTIEVKGFWKIVGRRLTMTATHSSVPRLFPSGLETNDEIVSITATQMVLINEDGGRDVFERAGEEVHK